MVRVEAGLRGRSREWHTLDRCGRVCQGVRVRESQGLRGRECRGVLGRGEVLCRGRPALQELLLRDRCPQGPLDSWAICKLVGVRCL